MYFPYLRGKQYELIALRELSEVLAVNSDKISPIIEPVKNSSTLKTTLKEFKLKDINFNIILNPEEGDSKPDTNELIDVVKKQLHNYTNYQIALIVKEETNISEYLDLLKKSNIDFDGITLIHFAITEAPAVIDFSGDFNFINNVVYFKKTSRRYYRRFDKNTCVGLEDFFDSQIRNADYLKIQDSQFSEEHLFYKQDGFKGFSDFLTIGDNYSETGFLPYAVAIHLSYIDTQKRIRIRHFVSDSNEDATDVGGKFAEALEKLISWCNSNEIIETTALSQFRKLHSTGHFPGLGSIKKLSIMHHIELVLNLI